MRRSLKWLLLAALSPTAVAVADDAAAESAVTQHDVLPYFYTRCVVCHGRRRREAELDLRSVASILKGGKSGPAVVPGNPEKSLLLKRVLAKDMPPPKELVKAGVRPLEPVEIDRIRRWIAQGAKALDIRPDIQTSEPDALVSNEDRQFWAFQPPQKSPVPCSESAAAPRSPSDEFLLRRLNQHGLTFSAEASRLELIRRVAFALTGLPPEWDDVEQLLEDSSDDWYATLVDLYLDSPHYGEQWGRYWLDLCGYADSEGKLHVDPVRPHAWRYRDYVIRSLNADKPYDQFLTEQIAGDELYDFESAEEMTREMMDALVATGFLRMAPDATGSDIVDTVEERFEVVADEIKILGSAVLGLTLECAQCHTHKYDPIPQRDYYRLVAVFAGAFDVYDWLKSWSGEEARRRHLKYVTADIRAEWESARRDGEAKVAKAEEELRKRHSQLRTAAITENLGTIPEELHDDLRKMLQTPEKERSEVEKYLAEKFEERLAVSDAALEKKHPALKKLREETEKRVKALRSEIPPEPLIRALWDRGEPSPTWIFQRGEFANPGDRVGPGALSVLTDGRTPFVTKPRRAGSTGRRLAFAKWLTAKEHPLTARVLVNRVWFHHFGRGIVESLENFGQKGTLPTHPQLLDWLAVSFVENGWSLKWLHRQIMNSSAYRQSSKLNVGAEERDPENRWLSRMPLRRLEAESVRDSLLAVSGQLDRNRFGAPDAVTVHEDGVVTSKKGANGWRRAVYVQQRRSELPTILETFDLPQMNPNCVDRPDSTVATQALHLMNDRMIRQLAAEFAKRVEADVPGDRGRQVERVFQIAVSRNPTPEERRHAVEAIENLIVEWESAEKSQAEAKGGTPGVTARMRALANLCHVMMNSAAFLFVD